MKWNPGDNQGARYLLASLYVEANAIQKARAILKEHGVDGMNVFTRCLVEVLDGNYLNAIDWLCRGVTYNVHFPLVASGSLTSMGEQSPYGVEMGSQRKPPLSCSTTPPEKKLQLSHSLVG